MTLQEVNKRLNEIRMAAFGGNQSAVDALKNQLYRDIVTHVAEAGDDDLRAIARAVLMGDEIEVM